MEYTLAEAVEVTGKSKSTLTRMVRRGELSATRNAAGVFRVDASELHRVFPDAKPIRPDDAPRSATVRQDQTEKPDYSMVPRADLDVMRERCLGLERQLMQALETVADLRRRLDDAEEERRDAVRRLLPAPKVEPEPMPPPQPEPTRDAPRSWWARVTGAS